MTIKSARELIFLEPNEVKQVALLEPNEVKQVALGGSASDAIRHAIFEASKLFHGRARLLITDMPKGKLKSLFTFMAYLKLMKVYNFQRLEALQKKRFLIKTIASLIKQNKLDCIVCVSYHF